MPTLHQHRAPQATHTLTSDTWHQASSSDQTLTLTRGGAVIDLATVERALNGEPVELTDDEVYEAARQLDQRGYQPNAIAERTGMHVRRVARWKAAGWPEDRPDHARGLRRGTPTAA
jgi:hypothetical protein